MVEELGQIDLSAIADLVRIKAEEEVLRERLGKMESAKEKVSAVVYNRVHADYQTRQAALDVESRPLKERARREYQKLLGLRREVERSVEEASLEKEELEFRRDLGEFPGDQFKQKLKECEMKLAQRRLELEDTDKIKEQFLGAFHSAEELAAAREPSAAALWEGDTVVGEGTPWTPAQSTPAPPVTSSGATVVMTMPRLVHITDGKPAEEYLLKPGATAIGRSPKSQIHLSQSAVSRHHADIVFGPEGYKVVDMGSPNGVIVNGQRVRERVLADGDVIVVGLEKLVYKA
ncbi:MAG: FHA domain-containing protein [Thermoanaerobaculia bacterium]